MGFQDELKSLSGGSGKPTPRYSLDDARIESAARDLLEEMKARLKTNVATGHASKAGVFSSKQSVTASYQIHPDKSLRDTPHQSTSSFEGEENVYWAFHDTIEARLVARRMSQLGASDGIRVTLEKHPNGYYYFFAQAKF